MKDNKFLEKLSKIIPELVYSDSLLDSRSLEIPVYFSIDEEENVLLDEESMIEEFNNKLDKVKELLK